MKKKSLFALWGGLFLLCAGLGFIPEPAGAVRWVLSLFLWACLLMSSLSVKQKTK